MVRNGREPVIAFLGPLPPPIGGYSRDLQRLTEKLHNSGYQFVVYDLLNKRETYSNGFARKISIRWLWALKYFFFAREDLICCHHIDWRVRSITGLMSLLGKKTLISIGGQGFQDSYDQGSWLRKKIIAFSLKQYSVVVAHNPVIKNFCLSLGAKPERVEIIYGFIPPLIKDVEINQIPKAVWQFIENHEPVICANAFQIVFYNGEDLYGIDLSVQLCTELKKYFPKIGFVFSLPNIGEEDYFREIKQKIADDNITENFLFITGSYEFYPILMKAQVFLRPTNTDGDATSLREALYFKVPSVASDVFPRPQGTVLFENRDISDLTIQVKHVLDKYELCKKSLNEIEIDDNFLKLEKVYRKTIGLTNEG